MASTTGNISTIHEEIKRTAEKFFAGYEESSLQKDPRAISAVLSPNCARQFGPPAFLKALGAPADMTVSNEQYEAQHGREMSNFSATGHEVRNLAIDAPARKASAYVIVNGELLDGSKFDNHIIWFLDFTEDGTQITKILMWLDSIWAVKFQQDLEASIAAATAKTLP